MLVRIRQYSGHEGGSNFYHHADLIVRSEKQALTAAQEGRVFNWRWVDTYDIADSNYLSFESLGRIEPEEAKNPRSPITHKEKKEWDEILENLRARNKRTNSHLPT